MFTFRAGESVSKNPKKSICTKEARIERNEWIQRARTIYLLSLWIFLPV